MVPILNIPHHHAWSNFFVILALKLDICCISCTIYCIKLTNVKYICILKTFMLCLIWVNEFGWNTMKFELCMFSNIILFSVPSLIAYTRDHTYNLRRNASFIVTLNFFSNLIIKNIAPTQFFFKSFPPTSVIFIYFLSFHSPQPNITLGCVHLSGMKLVIMKKFYGEKIKYEND